MQYVDSADMEPRTVSGGVIDIGAYEYPLSSAISNELLENSIDVFPNPTNSTWQLTVSPDLIGGIAEVFDGTGRLVFKSNPTALKSLITISDAASGVYELRIISNEFALVRKLLKM